MQNSKFQQVSSVALPAEASIAGLYPGSQLADAYSVHLPAGVEVDPERLARCMFANLPRWARALMRLRDVLVAGFGIKTAAQMQAVTPGAAIRRIDMFRIYSGDAREIVFGEDDIHLDFRVSLLCRGEPGADDAAIVVVTAVHCHNRLGRVYLFLIAPFHRLIAQAMLRGAARAAWRDGLAGQDI
ncbi:DUF2867 domain-containing protein [Janthinobacterium fluminis]|uniref:DUF2867 domain-containing protein n=1 Tax=Janthinobacterium fluminis TaxID=2987524 RepID=A0ABT5JTR4_9BURK|nr:DUF2867 domain-containing protein [Janthinobacterium fluminis]MDC8756129.1 DUF2867 domain-containing protein [Janthinobacterium fluminis]